jgi:hypothetical protein
MVISIFKLQNFREKQTLGRQNRKTERQYRICTDGSEKGYK